ncbi:MAG TPA: pitrilysin family protein [Longimicrobiales bacterium]|nr:pitrilysin family protein [Longimicrobiales bacterium]
MTSRATPAVGAPPRLLPLDVRTHTFSNGLLLACVAEHRVPSVDIEIVVRAGAALDDPPHAGRAAMVAEMLDEGTTSRTVLQIADEIDFLGAHLAISAGWDSTVIGLHVTSERLTPALEVMADVILHPSFPPAEFERKKREKLSALLQERAEARLVANKVLMQGVFGAEHPYGAPVGGTTASVTALQLADVRAFYQAHFQPANTFAVVVGAVNFTALALQLEELFGAWRGHRIARRPMPPAPAVETARVLLVDKPGAAQAEIRIGHGAPGRDTEDYFSLLVLNTMLGGSFTSRLNLRLREQMAVTYGASSKFNLRVHGGMFWAGSAVDSDAAADSVAVVLHEMKRLRAEPIDVAEMRRAGQYLAYGLPRHFETTEDIAAHLREQLLYGLSDDYWWRFVDRILAVTPAEVSAAAARHLQPEHAVAAIVADRNVIADDLQNRDLGAVILTEIQT